MSLLTFFAAFLTGILAAMGVGGGMILILWLTVFMGTDQITAQGTNLIFFLPIALLSVIIHNKNGYIKFREIYPAIITGIAGACLGAFTAEYLGSPLLRKIFGGFILLIGIKSLFARKEKE
ncbi:MAG: sulfite exporter TauE/SafE family protein [Huintestinicola sp.]